MSDGKKKYVVNWNILKKSLVGVAQLDPEKRVEKPSDSAASSKASDASKKPKR